MARKKDQVLREYVMASAVIRQYLQVFPQEITDPFMLNEAERGDNFQFEHMRRVCSLADYIFALRNVSGFDVLLERLAERDVRASYFEARAANSPTEKFAWDREP